MQIQNALAALTAFCQAATKQAEATKIGDYKIGNEAHEQLITALQWLETHQQINLLTPLLASPQASECLWAATYLLLHQHSAAESALQRLARQPGILGFNAELALREWRAGRLTSLW
jgi:hypothetical protein